MLTVLTVLILNLNFTINAPLVLICRNNCLAKLNSNLNTSGQSMLEGSKGIRIAIEVSDNQPRPSRLKCHVTKDGLNQGVEERLCVERQCVCMLACSVLAAVSHLEPGCGGHGSHLPPADAAVPGAPALHGSREEHRPRSRS